MQLVSIALKNIRSYTNAKIDFPTGIVLLSGDIGSGKSTILLAVEFALFGILRGELSGNALLRNGTQEGSVELSFKIKENNYTIKRALRRTKKSVEQEAGYLLINGVKKEATATELKSHILDLLGYPQELLTKTKNFVFRYTVYTPQEEMKRILLEDKEDRVAILRKVFGIDKYEKITQNASFYTKSLRERKRAFDAVLADAEEKKKQAEETKKEYGESSEQLKLIIPQLDIARVQLEDSKKQLLKVEEQKQKTELITRELHVTKSQVLSKQQQQKQVQTDLITVSQQLAAVELPAKIDVSALTTRNTELNQQLLENEKSMRLTTMKIAELNALKKQATETTQKITSLAKCPTCLQEVTADHKHQILSTEQQKMQKIDENLVEHSTLVKQSEQVLAQLKTELEQLRKQEQEAAVAKVKIMHAEELAKRKNNLELQNTTVTKEVQISTERLTQLEQQLAPMKNVEVEYDQLRKQTEKFGEEERKYSIQHSTLLQKEQHLAKNLKMLEEELGKKKKVREQLEKTQHLHQWLTDYFVPLMDVIEKHVMAKIHHEFNALFQQWFSMLVEDVMTARLDETFTPIVQQNGYDTAVENLSGGERTACALAYRLALNKTINSFISCIKTRDLLILDEPTDGFSTEQLDKMRDVLDQLHLNQIIMVSHEQKIESFADKVIHVNKTEHTSQISF